MFAREVCREIFRTLVNLNEMFLDKIVLDLHDVSLLQAKVQLAYLCVSDETNHTAELADAVESCFNVLGSVFVLLGGC